MINSLNVPRPEAGFEKLYSVKRTFVKHLTADKMPLSQINSNCQPNQATTLNLRAPKFSYSSMLTFFANPIALKRMTRRLLSDFTPLHPAAGLIE
jgi:hypothetical protein